MSEPVKRRPASVMLDDMLMSQAEELHIDLTGAAEHGIAAAIKAERERLWRAENADATAQSNGYAEKNGLPLAKFRMF